MNIQNLTLDEISVAVLFAAGLIGGIKYLKDTIKEAIEKILEDQFKGINEKLNTLDIQMTKNFLVRYLADVERENVIYDAENRRFWEEYDHYKDDLKQNSYVKKWVQDLEAEGKLKARPVPKEE